MTEPARTPETPSNTGVPANRYVLFAALAIGGVTFDLWTKHAVFGQLGYPNGQSAWQWESPIANGWLKFRFHTTFNHGALWGVGQGMTWLFTLLSIAAVVGVIVWLFVFSAARSAWLTTALGLVLGGTLGNLYDRLGLHRCIDPLTGEPILAVRDFMLAHLGTYPWPVFNFADVFLVTGAVMLVIQSLFFEQDKAATAEAPTAENATSPPNSSATSAA